MILQLSFFLNTGFDKCIVFEIIILIGKKPFKPSEKLKKNYISIDKNLSKLNEKTKNKTEELDQ